MRQLSLFESDDCQSEAASELNASLWQGSFNGRESSIQQLAPYVGKLKSGMAKALIERYSQPGDRLLDPFAGAGTVPLEALLAQRQAWANDLSPYAYAIARGKLEAPEREYIALQQVAALLKAVNRDAKVVDLSNVPAWVQSFFHPDTLREILVAVRWLKEHNNFFLLACLLGILQHVRPGFLSYPASHLVPYLRRKKYPVEEFPEMYAYRDLGSRLTAKVKRAYRRAQLPSNWAERRYQIWQTNSMALPIDTDSIDAIVSSPPYFSALDYARDNRLRLWFLGCPDWKALDAALTAQKATYLEQMAVCLREMARVLKSASHCVLVLGDVERQGKTQYTAELLAELATDVTLGALKTEVIYRDRIPEERRSRRRTQTTKTERILVLRKH